MLFFSCAKDRPEQIEQAQRIDLQEVTDIQGKEFEVTTIKAIHDDSPFTDANVVSVEKGVSGINNYKFVDYKTESQLFQEVPFFGKENTTYKIKYDLTDDMLIISKLSKKEDLPFQELTYAEKIGDDLYKVPMVGYPVALYRLERILNENNESTHRLMTVKVNTLAEATHLKVDIISRKDFDSVTKNNVFKSDLLEGEWFYASTVVSASPELANTIGRDLSLDFKARSVSRIKFLKRYDSIVGVNLNIDDNIDTSEEINLKEALSIPVEYLDYKVKKVGNKVSLSEEEVGNDHAERRNFKEREFMKMKLAETHSLLSRDNDKAILDSLDIGKDFLSFVVYYPTNEIKIRYALRKAHKPKEGRVYYKDDRKTFGFFSTQKYVILNHRFEREEDYEKLIFLNRFYPDEQKVVYYFSHNTPENLRDVGRESIKVWNEAFAKAGSGISIVLDESKDVNIGDIRFNIINIVDTKDGARLLGYGPSIVDSESGEIISATSNIYANPFRESWIRVLRNYVRSKLGKFNVSAVGAPDPAKMTLMTKMLDDAIESVNKVSEGTTFTNSQEEVKGLGLSENSPISFLMNIKEEVKKENLNNPKDFPEEGPGHINSFDITHKDAIAKVEATCNQNSELTNYIDELKAANLESTPQELELLNGCADKLLKESVLSTLVHELGHNFGLRHNFIASTDTENFTLDKDGKPVAQTSSIMDYAPGSVDELLGPGNYDIAAIRFGYANSVELKDGSSKSISLDKSLAEQEREKGLDRKEYKFCTDEHVQRTNPLCQRHDFGTNPKEVVDNIIHSFNTSYSVYGKRYDRAFGPSSVRFGINHLLGTFFQLKKVYDQWRYHLREFVGERNQYLDEFDSQELLAELESMKSEGGRHAENYRLYYEAADTAYNFIKEIIFTPALTCAGTVKNGPPMYVFKDFERIKEQVFKDTNVMIDNCDHPMAVAYMDEINMVYVGQFGRFFNAQKTTLDIDDIDYNNTDAVGFNLIKTSALTVLTMRAPMMQHLVEENFAPNFLDNPVYREEIINNTFNRVIMGIDSEKFGYGNAIPIAQKMFTREKDFLIEQSVTVVKSLNIPGKLEKSDERLMEFSPMITTNPRAIPDGAVVTRFRHFYIATMPVPEGEEQPLVLKLINVRKMLQQELNMFDQAFLLTEEDTLKVKEAFKELGIIKDFNTFNFEDLEAKDLFNSFLRLANLPKVLKGKGVEKYGPISEMFVGIYATYLNEPYRQAQEEIGEINEITPAYLDGLLLGIMTNGLEEGEVLSTTKIEELINQRIAVVNSNRRLALRNLDAENTLISMKAKALYDVIFGVEGNPLPRVLTEEHFDNVANQIAQRQEQLIDQKDTLNPFREDKESQLDIITEILLKM